MFLGLIEAGDARLPQRLLYLFPYVVVNVNLDKRQTKKEYKYTVFTLVVAPSHLIEVFIPLSSCAEGVCVCLIFDDFLLLPHYCFNNLSIKESPDLCRLDKSLPFNRCFFPPQMMQVPLAPTDDMPTACLHRQISHISDSDFTGHCCT